MPSSGGPGGQWNVAALLARRPAAATKNKRSRGARFESRFEYLVQWEDRDPTTGETYEPSWEPTTFITPAAIESYYIDKYEGANAQRQGDDAAHAAPTAAAAGADDVSAAAPDPAPRKETVTATAVAVPAKANNEAVPRRAKNTRAEEATPKRQKSARTANSGAKDKEKQRADGGGGAAAAAATAVVTAPAPRKRGTSQTPDKENTKRIRVADMLLT